MSTAAALQELIRVLVHRHRLEKRDIFQIVDALLDEVRVLSVMNHNVTQPVMIPQKFPTITAKVYSFPIGERALDHDDRAAMTRLEGSQPTVDRNDFGSTVHHPREIFSRKTNFSKCRRQGSRTDRKNRQYEGGKTSDLQSRE